MRRLSLNSLEKIGSEECKKMKAVRKQGKVVRRKPEVEIGKAKKKRRDSTEAFARRTGFIHYGVSVAGYKLNLAERCAVWWKEYLERIDIPGEKVMRRRRRRTKGSWRDFLKGLDEHGMWKCKWRKTWWKEYVKDRKSGYYGSDEEEEEKLVCIKSDFKYDRIWKLGEKPVRKHILINPTYWSEREKSARELAMRAEFGVKTASDGVLYNGEWYKGVKWRDEIKVVVEKYEGE